MGPTHNMPEELRRQISVVANGRLDKETDRQTDIYMHDCVCETTLFRSDELRFKQVANDIAEFIVQVHQLCK
jgi:hypothetical protein